MKKYEIYGIGAALVDTEVVVSDEFLKLNAIKKGVMTLVDEPRQAALLNAFSADNHHLMKKSGGSACNTVIAAANFGAKTFFSGKVADDDDGEHFVADLAGSGVSFHKAAPAAGVTGKCLVMVTNDAERPMNTTSVHQSSSWWRISLWLLDCFAITNQPDTPLFFKCSNTRFSYNSKATLLS